MIKLSGSGPTNGCCPSRLNQSGKPLIERSSTRMRAMPRKPISPASVTASDGSPMRAIQKPLNAPHATPTASAMTIPSGTGTPRSKVKANVAAASAITDATERSISALMITSVNTNARMIFSMES